ncbi:putative RNA recognition domain-containing protein [Rosellinia necatrix]|uniref:Putative RNA recognition domain-containing protein n=1 Tax=Rosellinia necatrix TaxID=77044 RepID=A0A1S7ULV4_ROSNE|nr:putative RNA recognition domain-containing protein [Rosellinia necatrix]
MESSRIFVRGLPPTINETELRKHFSKSGHVSDIKCFPQRRIGYVGFKTSQEAAEAVKYFNRSFIRMSRINVELARPIADLSSPRSESSNGQLTTGSTTKPAQQPLSREEQRDINAKKRKRDALNESDPKLQEFLNVMQASKLSEDKLHGHEDTAAVGPPSKKVAIVDEAESGDEYQSMPAHPKKQTATLPPKPILQSPERPPDAHVVGLSVDELALAEEPNAEAATHTADSAQNAATGIDDDDDWLRKKTNRLLDLANDGDIVPIRPQPIVPGSGEGRDTEPMILGDDSLAEEGTVTATEESREMGSESQSAVLDAIRKTSRIFCRNLPYDATSEDLRNHFEKFGEVDEVHVPSDASNKNRGLGFILFHDSEAAVRAFQSDRTTFQGRLLHVLPAKAKTDELDEFALAKLPLRQQNLIKKRKKAAAATWSWNSLYMSQDAVNTSVADRLGISKNELLDPTSSDAGIKQALAESEVIQDTKAYFAANGVNLDSFKLKPRSDDVILVKNLDANTKAEEIRKLFEEHGRVLRVLIPPTGVIAIVQFASPSDGKRAFAKLAYRRFGSAQLFLEKAPRDLFFDSPLVQSHSAPQPAIIDKVSAADLLEEDSKQPSTDATLFVKNLNFDTDTNALADAFQHLEGFKSALVKTKKDLKRPGQTLSMGFGFVSFDNSDSAAAAVKVMDGHVLMGHKLHIRGSHRGLDAAEERKKKDEIANKATCTLIVKNLPFQASKREIKALFSAYSQIKAVRMPKKFNHSGRGFAFVDFLSSKDASSALQALEGTHLLGRRLIIQYAEADAVDAEEEIAKMQKKVGGQVNKVALQELTGRGRKKFNVEGDRDEGE